MVRVAVPPEASTAGRLVTVGTGTCVPQLRRGGPCTLLEASGSRCVVDLGLGALHGLLRAGVGHHQVDALLLTHHHPDHVAELLPFLFAANYDQPPRCRPLVLAASGETLAAVVGLAASQPGWLEAKHYPLKKVPLSPGAELRLGPLTVRAGAVSHIDSSLAYRFDHGSRAAVLSGDTGPSATLAELARGADLLLAEASLPPGTAGDTHLSPEQAGRLARQAGVKELVLNHIYPAVDEADPAAAAAEAFGGAVTVAEDGMEWVL